MSQTVISQDAESLTGLLMPLADRMLLVPNVAVAELIPYRAPQAVQGMPAWFLGQVQWRDLSLPLLSFRPPPAASRSARAGGRAQRCRRARSRQFIALLVQGIPHSIKVDASLARADVELAPLELDAVNLGDMQARIPDRSAWSKLADAGLI